MKILFLILFALLPVFLMSGCSNHISPHQAAIYNQIDSEAKTDLGAIYTDEMAFNAMNDTYISAGYYSTKGLNLSVNTFPHKLYTEKIPSTARPPFKCVDNILKNKSGKIKSGFPIIGFSPMGKINFYYFIKALPSASKTLPVKLSSPPALPSQPYVSCGNGYEAFAVSNFTGNNIQVYAVNDYSANPVLVYGKSYRKLRQNVQSTQKEKWKSPPPPPANFDLYKTN